jgi:hypothetical protein
MSSSPLLFNIVISSQSNKARERNKREMGKEEVKLSLFSDDILYLSGPKNSAKKLQYLINTFSNVTRYKIRK